MLSAHLSMRAEASKPTATSNIFANACRLTLRRIKLAVTDAGNVPFSAQYSTNGEAQLSAGTSTGCAGRQGVHAIAQKNTAENFGCLCPG